MGKMYVVGLTDVERFWSLEAINYFFPTFLIE